ncbi:unnamed protein product, partial [Hapterophycus canaliculatus]
AQGTAAGGGANGVSSGDGERETNGSSSRVEADGARGGGSGNNNDNNNNNNASASSLPSAPVDGVVTDGGGDAPREGAATRAAGETSGVGTRGHGDDAAAAATTGDSPPGAGADGAEGAAGGYWGLSGWFSRRSGASSSTPPLGEGSPGGALRDRRRVDGSGLVGRGTPGGGKNVRAGATTTTAAARGKGAARRTHRTQGRTAPSPLSMEVVGVEVWQDRGDGGDSGGGGGGTGYASETDEDEDLYGKTLRPTSEQLAALRLRAGCNTVEFVVRVAGQAERVVSARAFLWGSEAKVVVSDIENTIARSGGGAGMGSFSQVVGPGVHKDVSTLFSKISRNGYKILYLTNRPLPDWHAKRGAAAAAEGGLALPRGPVLCPPEVLFRGSSSQDRRGHQEVFKMTALRGLKLIFPADVNPLYAGFGNSVSDMVAYKKASHDDMAVPEGRIFLINSMGELHNINHTYRQTYLSLSRHVDLTFPPLPHDGADDSCDDRDAVEDHEDEDDVADSDYDGTVHNDRGRIDSRSSSSNNTKTINSSAGGNRPMPVKSLSLSSMTFVATGGGVDGSGSSVADAADGGNASVGGGGDISDGGGGAYVYASLAASGAVAIGDASRDDGNMRKLGHENGGVGLGDEGHRGAGGSKSIAKLKTKTKTTALIPRKWEEVAPRREKSFYPNRAAVEDRFTDLNFWREPPPLVGDEDEDDEGDDDGDSQDEDEEDE